MMKAKQPINSLIILLVIFLPVTGTSLTLDEAVALALTHNPALQKQQLNLALSHAELNDQQAREFGKINVVANYGHYNNPRTLTPLTPAAIIGDPYAVPTTEDLFSAGVMYEVPLFTGFAQQHSVAIAGLEKEMAGVAIKLSREQLIYNVKTLYINILSLKAQKKAQQEYYNALNYLYDDIVLKVKLGKKARVDQLKAAADKENSKLKVRQFIANIKIMKSSLAVLLNSDTISPLEDSFMAIQPGSKTDYSNDFKQLGRYRSAVLDVEKNTRLEQKSKAVDYPQIDFKAYYGQNFGPNDSSNENSGDWNNAEDWQVGINVKWSIYDFGSRHASKRKAALLKLQSQKDKVTTELELKQSLSEAVIQIQLAIDDFNSAETELALTRETERIEQIRFTKGAADMDDLLYAKARNQLALSRSISARYSYQNRRFYLDYLLEKGEHR